MSGSARASRQHGTTLKPLFRNEKLTWKFILGYVQHVDGLMTERDALVRHCLAVAPSRKALLITCTFFAVAVASKAHRDS